MTRKTDTLTYERAIEILRCDASCYDRGAYQNQPDHPVTGKGGM